MKIITIKDVDFTSFGSNNYSCGMEMITAWNYSGLVEKVLKGEYPGVYLNPSAICNEDGFYGVYGTPEQYKEFYKSQKEAQIAKKMLEHFGFNSSVSIEEWNSYEKELRTNYKDWWE